MAAALTTAKKRVGKKRFLNMVMSVALQLVRSCPRKDSTLTFIFFLPFFCVREKSGLALFLMSDPTFRYITSSSHRSQNRNPTFLFS